VCSSDLGEVIGITSAKISAVGIEGMGYAISIKDAIPIIGELIQKGYVSRAYLGVSTTTVTQTIARVNKLTVNKGAVITEVYPGSPAANIDLKKMDVITRFNGKEIATSGDLIQAILNSKINVDVPITFIRGQETKTISVTMAERQK
jgi:serine protease Do